MKKKLYLVVAALAGMMMCGASVENVWANAPKAAQNESSYPDWMMDNPMYIAM